MGNLRALALNAATADPQPNTDDRDRLLSRRSTRSCDAVRSLMRAFTET